MAAYRRVYDSHHPQADCQEPRSAPELYDRQSTMGYLFLFLKRMKTQQELSVHDSRFNLQQRGRFETRR